MNTVVRMMPVPDFPYEVSSLGEVYRIGSLAPLRPAIGKRGSYLQVALNKNGKSKTRYVHQLVAIAFHGPRPSERHHAAHRDGNKRNNTPENVQWITKEENEADKIRHGTSNRGERCGTAKLTQKDVIEIRRRMSELPRSSGGCRIKKGAQEALAAEYGVTKSCLWQACNTRWRDIA